MSEESGYTPSQWAIVELWEKHTAYGFGDRPTGKTLAQDLIVQRRAGDG